MKATAWGRDLSRLTSLPVRMGPTGMVLVMETGGKRMRIDLDGTRDGVELAHRAILSTFGAKALKDITADDLSPLAELERIAGSYLRLAQAQMGRSFRHMAVRYLQTGYRLLLDHHADDADIGTQSAIEHVKAALAALDSIYTDSAGPAL